MEYLSIASEPLIANSESATALESEAPSTEILQTEILQDALLTIPTLAKQQPAAQPTSKKERRAEVQIFLSTFFTIFLAELGDKTQVTTLLMSAESHSPWVVFAGAGTALVATSLIGVWLGCWLAKRVSAKTLETATGGLLLLVSVLLLWDVVHL